MTDKTRIGVGLGAAALVIAVVMGVGSTTSSTPSRTAGGSLGSESGFSGYKGDRNARALQADTGLNDPAGYATTVCNLRAQGFSEQRTIELNATGLHGERERTVTDQDALIVIASEYHFCPEYYHP